MTTALVSDRGRLELSYKEAEATKRDIGIPDQESGTPKEGISSLQLLSLVRPVLEKLIAEVKRSFDYCKFQLNLPAPNKLLLTGGGSLLRNLDKMLAKELEIEVDYIGSLSDPFVGTLGFTFASDFKKKDKTEAVFFDVAVASALEEAKGINLFPPELIAQRVRRLEMMSLKIAASTAVLVLFVLYMYMSFQVYSLEKQIKIAQANFDAMQEVTILKDKIDNTKMTLLKLIPVEYNSATILKIISRIIQPTVELDSLTYKETDGIDIRGTVASAKPEAALANFIKYMREIGIFKNVKIMSLQKDTNQLGTSIFTMSCDILPKEQ
jgi:hypothetical protein